MTCPLITDKEKGHQQEQEVKSKEMNGLSLSELCYLFCCPPCPSRITAKLAFLPPSPTYAFVEEDSPSASSSSSNSSSSSPPTSNCSLHLTEKAEWQYSPSELEVIDVFYTRSRRGNRIACMYVKITESPEFTILFSHGNAVDLGQMSSFFIGLGTRVNCNILAYDYSGYGASSGKATEANIYSDAEATWEALRTRYGLRPDQIILYGQSIGTAAAVDLATRHDVAGIVLHSPLMSGMRVACPDVRRTWCFDSFAR